VTGRGWGALGKEGAKGRKNIYKKLNLLKGRLRRGKRKGRTPAQFLGLELKRKGISENQQAEEEREIKKKRFPGDYSRRERCQARTGRGTNHSTQSGIGTDNETLTKKDEEGRVSRKKSHQQGI